MGRHERKAFSRSATPRPRIETLESRRLLDATGLFEDPATTALTASAGNVALADIDDDGDLDILIAQSDGLRVQLNDGTGSFTAGTLYGAGTDFSYLALANLDGDDDLDVIAVESKGSTDPGFMQIFLNDGAGTLTASEDCDTPTIPSDVTTADLDGDGDLDILVTSLGQHVVSIFYNDGSAHFTGPTNWSAGTFPVMVVAADFKGDGLIEIATVGLGDNRVRILRLFAEGLYIADGAYNVGAQSHAMAAADLDGDGDLDIVTGDQFGAGFAVLLNNGDGTFADFTPVSAADGIKAVKLADVNDDGAVDIIGAGITGASLFVATGNGDGTFDSATAFDAGEAPNDVAAGDVNDDGYLDLVSVGNNNRAILLNTLVEPPPAPTSVDLADAADTGSSSTDDITQLNNAAGSLLSFTVTGTQIGATVRVYAGGILIAEAVADSATTTLTGNGTELADGDHAITALQSLAGRDSASAPGFTLTIDTTAPVFTSAADPTATEGEQYTYDAATDDEQTGQAIYSIATGPAAATIDAATGEFTWTPALADIGLHNVTIHATDVAGNVGEQPFALSVEAGVPRPDLAAALDTSALPQTLVPGDKGKVYVTLQNEGDGQSQGTVTITILASTDQTADAGDAIIGQVIGKTAEINAGSSKTYRVKINVPGDAEAGQYYLIAQVDTSNIVGERSTDNDTAVTATPTDVAWRFGTFDERSNVKLTVADAQGTLITFKLSVAGFGEITGGSAMTLITLTGTGAASTLKIASADNAPITLNDVTATGPLKAFKAKTATIAGTFHATAAVGAIQWAALSGTVDAAGITTVKLSGHSSGDWQIAGTGLGKATIHGSVTAGAFTVAASTAKFTVKGSVEAAASITLATALNIKITGNLLGDITLISANKVTVGGQWSGTFTATTANDQGVGKFTIKGAALNATLDVMADVGNATFASLDNVNIYVGVDTGALAALGDLPNAFARDSLVSKLKVKGATRGATLAAQRFGNLGLQEVLPDATLALAATTVTKATMTLEGDRYTFKDDAVFQDTPALPYLNIVQI
ncbi:MAG: VCBS repeat-containing protein [Phycisphaerales bacterium]|nr:VCBS repeat-containing protein [Phycisphaerales bacterium]